jgi:hypothetical protein
MKMKKFIFPIIDLIAFGIGVPTFVNGIMRNDDEVYVFGSMMIVTGFLIRNWRKQNSFQQKRAIVNQSIPTNGSSKSRIVDDRSLIVGILLIVAFTFAGHLRDEIRDVASDVSSLDQDIRNIPYEIRRGSY